jgi:hypothetical protein
MKLNVKAIYTGSIFDLGVSYFFSVIAWATAKYWLIFQGVPLNQVADMAYGIPLFITTLTTVGLVFDALGGFVAANIAGHKQVLHSALASIPVVIVNAIYHFDILAPSVSTWSLYFCIPAYIVGGLLAKESLTLRSRGTPQKRVAP